MFYQFYANTTVSADEMNSNFQHVGSGDWLPLGGNTLEATTGVYDIGSQSYPWNNVYCHTLNVSGYSNTGCWNMVTSATLSSTASSIEFTGLNGDIFQIRCSFIVADPLSASGAYPSLRSVFNNDSSASYGERARLNYGSLYLYAASTQSSINIYNLLGTTTSDTVVSLSYILYAKPGYERLLLYSASKSYIASEIDVESQGAYIWQNTTDTITSIKFYLLGGAATCRFRTGTAIQIWRAS